MKGKEKNNAKMSLLFDTTNVIDNKPLWVYDYAEKLVLREQLEIHMIIQLRVALIWSDPNKQ